MRKNIFSVLDVIIITSLLTMLFCENIIGAIATAIGGVALIWTIVANGVEEKKK